VGGVLIQWSSSAPAGTTYQVYVARQARVARHGEAGDRPPARREGPDRHRHRRRRRGDDRLQSSLAAATNDRAELTWLGGTYLDATGNDDVAGFRVYSSAVAGGAVDYTNRLASIPAYDGGIIADGYGAGGYGQGGYGKAASSYAWTSDPLERRVDVRDPARGLRRQRGDRLDDERHDRRTRRHRRRSTPTAPG
jgi:hypothetical protein